MQATARVPLHISIRLTILVPSVPTMFKEKLNLMLMLELVLELESSFMSFYMLLAFNMFNRGLIETSTSESTGTTLSPVSTASLRLNMMGTLLDFHMTVAL